MGDTRIQAAKESIKGTPLADVNFSLGGTAVGGGQGERLWAVCLHPRALAAYRRAEGRAPEDAPLVEAPAFMSPPPDRRDLPMHYVPPRKTLLDRAGSLVHTTFSLAGLRPARGRGKAA
jgi:hypothetical protein